MVAFQFKAYGIKSPAYSFRIKHRHTLGKAPRRAKKTLLNAKQHKIFDIQQQLNGKLTIHTPYLGWSSSIVI